MNNEKILMAEAATLYYEKKFTQQEIAKILNLSRQTVSKLLGDALRDNIVEIKIHNPESDCKALEKEICTLFGIKECKICSVSGKSEALRYIKTVNAASDYLVPILEKGNLNIALSWGRTIGELINQLPPIKTKNNIVFPLFGGTEHEISCFSSNELARSMADKIGAKAKYAWFPYLLQDKKECDTLKTMSYYKNMQNMWQNADIALVGIGDKTIYETFCKAFGQKPHNENVTGDIATHFFNCNGELIKVYENTLCSSEQDIKNAKTTVAIACGDYKVNAINGALKTGLIDVLITDEHTAKQLLNLK